MRTEKVVNGVTHTYYYSGTTLLRETYGNNTLDFFYDANGIPFAMKYNGTMYYYITNLQGDVIRVVDVTADTVALYGYAPYGKVTFTWGSLTEVNPLRYRGYYYDQETGLYYTSSRYYDPEICRFINADDSSMLGANGDWISYNLYAYCGNNPIIREDKGGEFWNIVAGAVAGAVISTVVQVADNLISGKDWHDGVALAAASGAITGGLAATGAGVVVQAIVSGVVSAGADFIDQATDVGIDNVNVGQVIISGVAGAVSGWIGGNGIQHKPGDLSKAKGIYKYTLEQIKEQVWSADKASTYLDLAADNLQKVWAEALVETTVRYTVGAVAAVHIKKKMVERMEYLN